MRTLMLFWWREPASPLIDTDHPSRYRAAGF
jgi:hypothetical protein